MQCTHCHTPIPATAVNTGTLVSCTRCDLPHRVDLFPAALTRNLSVTGGETRVSDEEAGCFYHPGKKAVVACESCGRFLCALCDVDLSGRHICFTCLDTRQKKKKDTDLENHRTLYDGIALRLAVFPLLIFWFTIITAPMSLYMSLRYWNAPSSIVGRTRYRLVLAVILASLQIIAWSVGLYFLVKGPRG